MPAGSRRVTRNSLIVPVIAAIAAIAVFAALTLVYKVSPNRRQPGIAWLQTGTIIATGLWVILTALLAVYYSFSDQLGNTYGPLLGIIAILTWAYATALALFLGIALAAQLEAVRAGVPGPRTFRRYNETVRDPEETSDSGRFRIPERGQQARTETAPSL